VASVLPSGLKATLYTQPPPPMSAQYLFETCPSATVHDRAASSLAVATVSPSGLNATPRTEPGRTTGGRPPGRGQSRVDLSSLPDATMCPSGLNTSDITRPVWPARAGPGSRLTASHKRTVWSSPPAARVRPSGLNATA
jgi:hypothetical protein